MSSELPGQGGPPPWPRDLLQRRNNQYRRRTDSDDAYRLDYQSTPRYPALNDPRRAFKKPALSRLVGAEITNAIPGWHLELTPTHQRLDHPFDATLYPYSLPSNFNHPGHRRKIKAYIERANPHSTDVEVLRVEHNGHTTPLCFKHGVITTGLVEVGDLRLLVGECIHVSPGSVNLWCEGIYLNQDVLSLQYVVPNFDTVVPTVQTSEREPSNWYGLHFAVHQINLESVKSFLDRAGNFEVLENRTDGWTPLLVGARMCRNTCLAAKRDPFSSASDKRNTLLSQYHFTMKFLLERGADPNVSRNGRDSLLEVAEGGDKDCFVLLLAYGADIAKTEVFCLTEPPSETKSRIQTWLEPWKALGCIESLPQLRVVFKDLGDEARNLVSQTVAMDWEIPLVIERIKRLNPEKSAEDSLLDEVVLIGYEKGPLGESRTGSFEATRCGEFVERTWPLFGRKLLADIAGRCSLHVSDNRTASPTCSPFVEQIFNFGSMVEVCFKANCPRNVKEEVLDLLIWLCKAIRIPASVDPLQLSSSGCEIFRVPSHRRPPGSIHDSPDNPERIPWIIMRFRLYRKPLSLPKGSCWSPLLQSCTIAEMNQREKSWKADFHGLKLSFDLMIRMAAVEYPLRVNDKLVFCGYETALTPIRVEGRYAQFHLDISTSGQINPYLLKTESACSSLDVKDFKAMVCYVGWCDVVQIRLGTRELPARVEYTSLRDRKKTLHWNGVAIGGQLLNAAPLQAGMTVQANFSFVSNRLSFSPASGFIKLLKDTSKQLAIILDAKDRCAWLVPKISLLLHMAHSWLDDAVDPIPFANPHINGEEVMQVLSSSGDIGLCGEGLDEYKLRTLMLGLNINLLQSIAHQERSEGKSIHGFEFMDIVREPGKGGFMKSLSVKAEGKNWIDIINEVDAVVVCSGIGQVIAPADDEDRKCPKCNVPPPGHDYLAAPLSCLELLVQRKGGRMEDLSSSISASVFVSDKRFWTLSGNPFMRCSHDHQSSSTCWERDDIFQQFSKLTLFKKPDVSMVGSPQRTFSMSGAVVFGTRMRC